VKRRRRKEPKYQNPYNSENELCDVFIEHARGQGWKIYPETANWDILIAKNIQIGIQAKLKDNVDVLSQACDWNHKFSDISFNNPQPHLKAVLVPRASIEFSKVAHALGLFVIEGTAIEWNLAGEGKWIKQIKANLDGYNKKYLVAPKNLCWVPEIEIDVPAGVKSPKQITPWKVAAVKICIKLKDKGYLTSKDFKEAKLSMTLWKKKKWLLCSDTKDGKLAKYIRNPNAVLPDEKYPEITKVLKSN
jgi:hypothetical protein